MDSLTPSLRSLLFALAPHGESHGFGPRGGLNFGPQFGGFGHGGDLSAAVQPAFVQGGFAGRRDFGGFGAQSGAGADQDGESGEAEFGLAVEPF